MPPVTIVWFRHDLRLDDNPALAAAAARGAVVPVFIWEPGEETPWEPGAASRWWLHGAVESLARQLAAAGAPLLIRRGPSLAALRAIASEVSATHVAWNRRYEPAVIKRDTQIKQSLITDGLQVESFNGSLLFEPQQVATKEGKPYQVFTPFWRSLLARSEPAEPVAAPSRLATLPAAKRACWARATTSSGGVERAGAIARSTTRSSRISAGQRFSETKSSGNTSYQGTGKGCRTVSVSKPSFTSLILRVP